MKPTINGQHWEQDERRYWVAEGEVDHIQLGLDRKTGRPMWVITVIQDELDEDKDVSFVSYYEPLFEIGDIVRFALSTKGESTVTKCTPHIVRKWDAPYDS